MDNGKKERIRIEKKMHLSCVILKAGPFYMRRKEEDEFSSSSLRITRIRKSSDKREN